MRAFWTPPAAETCAPMYMARLREGMAVRAARGAAMVSALLEAAGVVVLRFLGAGFLTASESDSSFSWQLSQAGSFSASESGARTAFRLEATAFFTVALAVATAVLTFSTTTSVASVLMAFRGGLRPILGTAWLWLGEWVVVVRILYQLEKGFC